MNICVATTTMYKSFYDPHLTLALKTFAALHNEGLPVIVVDGSPCDIRSKLHATGSITTLIPEPPDSTMGNGRRLALREAGMVGDIVFWMEPEKYPLVPFIRKICEPIAQYRMDIVIPRRADRLMSYPEIQRLAETLGNTIFRTITGIELDVWFGPRAMNAKGLRHFTAYTGEPFGDKWHSIFIPLLTAIKDKLMMGEVAVNYTHPPEQAEEESHNFRIGITKRLEQLYELGAALARHAKQLDLVSD